MTSLKNLVLGTALVAGLAGCGSNSNNQESKGKSPNEELFIKDVDKDGKLDLVMYKEGRITLMLGDEKGHLRYYNLEKQIEVERENKERVYFINPTNKKYPDLVIQYGSKRSFMESDDAGFLWLDGMKPIKSLEDNTKWS